MFGIALEREASAPWPFSSRASSWKGLKGIATAGNTFSIQTSITAPVDCDRTAVNTRKRTEYNLFGNEGSLFRADPSPRLGLGIFNGRRPVRESQRGNGAERRPFPVSSTAPHYRRTKSESQEFLDTGLRQGYISL